MKGNSPWLVGIGGACALLLSGVIVWGRVRSVDVPRPASLCDPPTVCAASTDAEEAVRDGVALLDEHGVRIKIGACGNANIVLSIDPTLDDRSSPDDIESRLHERTARTWEGAIGSSCVTHAEIGVLDRSDITAVAHGLLHAVGYDHPLACPRGHILHPSAPGSRDWRGIP